MKNSLKKFEAYKISRTEMGKTDGGSYTCIFHHEEFGWLDFQTGGSSSWGEYAVFDDPHGLTYCTQN